ncbi:ElyC/SanA/YdcF family protein [Shewanella maritima]|uniref:ElyC/SanA/YdcF family protein n=1 Tax=Shewanella maritima TaxID=2520507 RepID=UPI0037355CAF
MFWVKKLVSQLFMPIPLASLLVVTGLLLICSGYLNKKISRARTLGISFIAVGVSLVVLLSQLHVSNALVATLEKQYPVQNQMPASALLTSGIEIDTPDRLIWDNKDSNDTSESCFVMVLGSGNRAATEHTSLQQLSSTALARLSEGVKQWQLAPQCKLIVSGWSGGYLPQSHAQMMANAAIEFGVTPEKIIRFDHPKDTIEEAQAALALIGEQPFRLVTSATHMPRSMSIFTYLGMQPTAAPSDFIQRHGAWWRLDAQHLLNSQKAIHEYVGRLWLFFKGYG